MRCARSSSLGRARERHASHNVAGSSGPCSADSMVAGGRDHARAQPELFGKIVQRAVKILASVAERLSPKLFLLHRTGLVGVETNEAAVQPDRFARGQKQWSR